MTIIIMFLMWYFAVGSDVERLANNLKPRDIQSAFVFSMLWPVSLFFVVSVILDPRGDK